MDNGCAAQVAAVIKDPAPSQSPPAPSSSLLIIKQDVLLDDHVLCTAWF